MLEILEKSHGKELAEHWPACVNGTPTPTPATLPGAPCPLALSTSCRRTDHCLTEYLRTDCAQLRIFRTL